MTASPLGWRRDAIVATLALTLVAVPVWIGVGRTRLTTGPDGIKYVQAAEHFLAGDGLVHTPHGPLPYDVVVEPLRLWPPGYPVLIAAVSAITRWPAADAALWIARVSWLLIPGLIVACLSPLRLGQGAVAVALLSAVTPGAMECANLVRSDLPFLALSVGSLHIAVRFAEGASLSDRWMTLSGLLAGSAFAFRNAGIALVASIPLGIFLARVQWRSHWASGRMHRGLLWFVLGTIPPVAAVLIRNMAVFGEWQPYEAPPSTIGVFDNLRWLLFALIWEVTGSKDTGWLAWNGRELAIAFAAALAVLLVLIGLARERRNSMILALRGYVSPTTLVLAVYGAIAAGLVVYSRSRFELDLINPRFALPFAWVGVAFAAIAAKVMWQSGPLQKGAVAAVLACLIVVRLVIVMRSGDPFPEGSASLALADDRAFAEGVRLVARDALVLSDTGPLLVEITRVGVREISADTKATRPNPFAGELARHLASLHERQRGLCFIGTDLRQLRNVASDIPEGFYLAAGTPYFVALCSSSVENAFDKLPARNARP